MIDTSNMGARPVQISLDEDLLRRIDAQPEARREGRSALIRSALLLYLRAKEKQNIDEAITKAYGGKQDELLDEIESLMKAQAWPKK
jgi:metal-responsive CopG/Arc/MetJ family transcriptional regulator